MPGKVKVKIISGRNLPVMDRSSDTTDAYVEIKLGGTTYKTDVCRKSLHPYWNSEWYRFEVDDSELQDEPLQIRLMDYDTYSANDAIGKVYLDLNPLLLPGAQVKYGDGSHDTATNSVMSGWIPVYDTMHGIRGEVNVTVKVELFSDFNRFRQSSCGIQFFCSKSIPHGFCAQNIHGFVEELIVNDDPEYQWIDKIRTPRASNEARQTLFFKLSGELQRKIGLKALDIGGNAVIGYCQCFDLEGESGIVARGIGTAVTLVKINDISYENNIKEAIEESAQNYLKFVSFQKGSFYLNPPSKYSDKLLSSKNLFDNLPSIDIENPRYKLLSKHSEFQHYLSSSQSNPSLNDNHNIHHRSVKTLLRQEDMRGRRGLRFGQKFKNLKYSSQSFLSKKMIELKAKLGDSGIQEEVKSDRSASLKRREFKAKRSAKNDSVMAELLARSVIHAHSSLTCILESQDFSLEKDESVDINEQKFGDTKDVHVLEKTVSEPVLSIETNESSTSLESSSSYSSSCGNDDSSDYKNESSSNFETLSIIIKNAEIIEKNYAKEDKLVDTNRADDFNVLSNENESTTTDVVDCLGDYLEVKKAPIAQMESSDDDEQKTDNKPTTIISSVVMPAAKKSLVSTAMQTILLDKVNIMGTYTPPITPIKRLSFFSNDELLSSRDGKFPRSKTALSLDEWCQKKPSALGASFMSMHNIGPTIEANIKQNREDFVHLLSKGDKYSSVQSEHQILAPRRKFSFLSLSRRKSQGSHSLKKVKSDELCTKPKFSFLRRRRNKSESEQHNDREKIKKQGLVNAALGNMVMETVHDMLASTKSDEDEKQIKKINTFVPLTPNTDINDVSVDPITKNNNKHASLTPSLRCSLPQTDSTNQTAAIRENGHHRAESVGTKLIPTSAKLNTVSCIYRRSSDSDLSITPKGNSLTGSDRSVVYNMKTNMFFRMANTQDFDMLEYPFLTMSKYPFGFIIQIGGAVSARSVKLLERISNFEEPESRDTWWSEIRMEIRSHARALNCNAVLGYVETTSVCEDVCVLSATGTAAVISFQNETNDDTKWHLPREMENENKMPKIQENNAKTIPENQQNDAQHQYNHISCSLCHLPYNLKNVHNRAVALKCNTCRTGKVPDVLIATIEAPDGTPILGRGCFIQSFVCRPLKDLRGESNAKEISDGLPFLEYELHRSLITKLKIKGMNSIFGLKVRISIGEKQLIALATGTALFLTPLPLPVQPKLVSDRKSDEKNLIDLQKLLNETVRKNREIYQLKNGDEGGSTSKILSDDDSEDELNSLDLSVGNKDCCILEVDDPQDAELLKMLMEERPPDGFHVVNTEFVPGLEDLEIVKNLQMFKQIYRAKFQYPYNFDHHFHRLLQSVYFKLRRMVPCALCDLQFRVELPETDEIQLCVLGMALGLSDPEKMKGKNTISKKDDDDLIFNLDEDQLLEQTVSGGPNRGQLRQKSPLKNQNQLIKQKHMPYKERHGVDITPLSYVPGGKIEHYLGNLNFFFIRETTSIREEGGLSGFIHSFVTEVLAIVRAHITALGGNAMVAYFMTECVLNHNLHKNQGQCLINVGGDVVMVSYFKEET